MADRTTEEVKHESHTDEGERAAAKPARKASKESGSCS